MGMAKQTHMLTAGAQSTCCHCCFTSEGMRSGPLSFSGGNWGSGLGLSLPLTKGEINLHEKVKWYLCISFFLSSMWLSIILSQDILFVLSM